MLLGSRIFVFLLNEFITGTLFPYMYMHKIKKHYAQDLATVYLQSKGIWLLKYTMNRKTKLYTYIH